MVTFFWIAFDVAISVRMMTTGYSWWEIALWFFGGLALAVRAWIVEKREATASDQKMTALEGTIGSLRQELAESRSYQSGKLDVIAMLGGETFHKLQNLTNTNAQPVVASIEAATSRIETLEGQLKVIQRERQRFLSAKQRDVFRDAMRAILKDTVLHFGIFYHYLDDEAGQYARQFVQILDPLGVTGVAVSTNLPEAFEGLVIRIKDHNAPVPVPPSAMRLSEALSKAEIPHRFDDLPPPAHKAIPADDYFDLAIGRKPD